MDPIVLLSLIVFVPTIGAFLLLLPGIFSKENPDHMRSFTFAVTVITFGLTVWLAAGYDLDATAADAGKMQLVFNQPWIPSFNIQYFMGIDGISLPLVVLTSFISMLAMGASWSKGLDKHVKAYCVLFLLLETGMLGVFMALDFFLFYVFWEVMLLPMYFLIGVWGGPRREYAAIKFFLYTLVGSVLMLIAILILYFNSDVRELAAKSDRYSNSTAVEWDRLHLTSASTSIIEDDLGYDPDDEGSTKPDWALYEFDEDIASGVKLRLAFKEGQSSESINVQFEPSEDYETVVAEMNDDGTTITVSFPSGATAADVAAAFSSDSLPSASAVDPIHTFNLLALAAIAQHTDCFSETMQVWCFVLLFIGFAIKVPAVPVHTWLPDAHVEAPTPISMILAGVLLKMGGYGIIRICYPICPFGGYELAYCVCLIGVISMVYGAFAAMAQKDFKRLVAYSSVSHMGYVVLGLGVWSAVSGTNFNTDYWNMGISGAMFQMIGHGVSSAGMFFMVGIIYDRVHHRNLDEFGGLFSKMPTYTALSIGIFFAGLGLPGLCGFIGEVFVVLSVWKYSVVLAVISAAVVILTAAYILWTLQRVYLGTEYNGPHEEEITPINSREFAVAVPLFVFAIVLGVFPHSIPFGSKPIPSVLAYMEGTVDRQVDELAQWAQRHEAAKAAQTPDTEDDDEDAVALDPPLPQDNDNEQDQKQDRVVIQPAIDREVGKRRAQVVKETSASATAVGEE